MLGDYTLYPIEFDVLDAAIVSFLENDSSPIVDVTREKISTALITYTLHDALGDYARVGIRKIDNEHSTLDLIQLPPQDGFLCKERQITFDMFTDKLVHAIANVHPKPPSVAPDALTSPTSGAGVAAPSFAGEGNDDVATKRFTKEDLEAVHAYTRLLRNGEATPETPIPPLLRTLDDEAARLEIIGDGTVTVQFRKDPPPVKKLMPFKELNQFIALFLEGLSDSYGKYEVKEIVPGMIKHTLSYKDVKYIEINVCEKSDGYGEWGWRAAMPWDGIDSKTAEIIINIQNWVFDKMRGFFEAEPASGPLSVEIITETFPPGLPEDDAAETAQPPASAAKTSLTPGASVQIEPFAVTQANLTQGNTAGAANAWEYAQKGGRVGELIEKVDQLLAKSITQPTPSVAPALSTTGAGDEQDTATLLDRTRLHEKIDRLFDNDDLRTLCFRLEIDYDNLSGDTKSGKVRELIRWCEKRNCFDKLVELLRKERPNVSW